MVAEVCTKLVVATSNRGKLAEFGRLLALLPVALNRPCDLLSLVPEVVEDGETFEENAKKKAHAIADATGELTLADDSGLEVDLLGGAPGVRSARFARLGATDQENIAALLTAVAGFACDAIHARFRCVLCLVDPRAPGAGAVAVTHGVCEGRIVHVPRGGGGFGYDPVFEVEGLGRTMAQLSPEEKNAVSHRAHAITAMRPLLIATLEQRGQVSGGVI